MNRPGDRISEEMVSKVLAEATRLNTESNQGYSLEELKQAGLEAQISPELIEQAVKVVQEREQAKQVKRQQARDRFRQRIKKCAPLGVSLGILLAVGSGILMFRPAINPLIKLPDLQNRVATLENEKQQTQVKLNLANQQLQLKKAEIDRLRESNDQTSNKLRELEREMARSKSLEVEPKSGVMFRDTFTKAVIEQTKYQVIQAVGKPDRTNDSGEYSFWYYDKKTKDRITGNLDRSICIFFVNGVADKVDSMY